MKRLYILWIFFLIGTFFIMFKLIKIEDEVGKNTTPPFNYIEFEIPPSEEYSKTLFTSIRENEMTEKVQESMNVDFWYIFFYVGTAIIGWILLLKKFKVERSWLYVLVAVLGIVAGVCDSIENGNLESQLKNWERGAMEQAAFFAKIKFAIILPLLGFLILGWGWYVFRRFRLGGNKIKN